MTELELNSLANLERTLADLGSEARQRRYKTAVPFVHIPIELAAQCAAYADQLDMEWFRALFDAAEIEPLSALFVQVRHYVRQDVVLDVDDGVLEDPAWREVMTTAELMHRRLAASGRFPSSTTARER